jgi:carbamoyl-phosphate synthase large subunit
VPFVAKAIGKPFASIAAKVMAGEKLSSFDLGPGPIAGKRFAVKEAVFPFSRFPGVDPLLGPEMRSTGEVMGIDVSFDAAYLKAQIAASMSLPSSGCVFISVRETDKPAIEQTARDIAALGFTIIATSGTAQYLSAKGIAVQPVNKVAEGQPHVVDALINGKIQLVFNTTEGAQSLLDSASIRRASLAQGIPYYTTISGARAATQAIRVLKTRPLEAGALQTYS